MTTKKAVKKVPSKKRVEDLIMTFAVGTKQLMSKKMTLGQYNKLRGWEIPANDDPKVPGYLVKYPDGYQSWSPKTAFEETYQIDGKMNFSSALFMLKRGCKLARKGWNGKRQWIIWIPGTENVKTKRGSPYKKAGLDEVTICGHIDMFTTAGVMQPGWLASQGDMAANDWGVVG